jgi:hypothetical protein
MDGSAATAIQTFFVGFSTCVTPEAVTTDPDMLDTCAMAQWTPKNMGYHVVSPYWPKYVFLAKKRKKIKRVNVSGTRGISTFNESRKRWRDDFYLKTTDFSLKSTAFYLKSTAFYLKSNVFHLRSTAFHL